MSLAPGTPLGPYQIVAPLGAGGMGEVYRARDTMLNREVAIKVLPDLFAADPDRLARFTREAQTLASLNHPNIAAIYGLEDSPSTGSGQAGDVRAPLDGARGAVSERRAALVMELVAGPTLAEVIAGTRDSALGARKTRPDVPPPANLRSSRR